MTKDYKNLFHHACSYFDFDFITTCILAEPLDHNFYGSDVLKSDAYNVLSSKKQSVMSLLEFDWKNAKGVGTKLGYKHLRALDFDNCNDLNLIPEVLNLLGLHQGYPWVVISGSRKGFHILFYCEDHQFVCGNLYGYNIVALKPNIRYSNVFSHMELRWSGHLVLPPSNHKSKLKYKFNQNSFPSIKPNWVSLDNLKKLLIELFSKDPTSSDFRKGYINLDSNFTYACISETVEVETNKFKPGDPNPSYR